MLTPNSVEISFSSPCQFILRSTQPTFRGSSAALSSAHFRNLFLHFPLAQLSSNRRDLWYSDDAGDLAGEGKVRADWNSHLLEDVVAPCYARLLLSVRDRVDQDERRTAALRTFYSLFPQRIDIPAPWSALFKAMITLIQHMPLLRIANTDDSRDSRWISPSYAALVNATDDQGLQSSAVRQQLENALLAECDISGDRKGARKQTVFPHTSKCPGIRLPGQRQRNSGWVSDKYFQQPECAASHRRYPVTMSNTGLLKALLGPAVEVSPAFVRAMLREAQVSSRDFHASLTSTPMVLMLLEYVVRDLTWSEDEPTGDANTLLGDSGNGRDLSELVGIRLMPLADGSTSTILSCEAQQFVIFCRDSAEQELLQAIPQMCVNPEVQGRARSALLSPVCHHVLNVRELSVQTLATVLPHILPEEWRSRRYVSWAPNASPSTGWTPSQTWMIALWTFISSELERVGQTGGPRARTDIIREHLFDGMPIVPVKMRSATQEDQVNRAVVVLSSSTPIINFGLSGGADSDISKSVLDSVSALGIPALGMSETASRLQHTRQSHILTTHLCPMYLCPGAMHTRQMASLFLARRLRYSPPRTCITRMHAGSSTPFTPCPPQRIRTPSCGDSRSWRFLPSRTFGLFLCAWIGMRSLAAQIVSGPQHCRRVPRPTHHSTSRQRPVLMRL